MHPQIRKSEPGNCPICGMELVPVGDGGEGSERSPRTFVTSPASAALMGIQTVPVVRDFADAEIRMVGKVDYDETRLSYITAWVPGRIEEMFVDFTGIRVKKGDHMVSLYSPDLITAQEELWRAAQAVANLREGAPAVVRNTAEQTLKAARNKLRRWGLNQAQIDAAESNGNASDRITIYAPVGGTVIHRNGQEGMYVDTGTRFYTLADLDRMWVKLDAYETDLPWLKFGQRVEFTTETHAGKVFEGRITFIDPFLDPDTRTAKVRVNVSNEDGLLKPEMFVSAVARPLVAMNGRVMDPEMVGKWISPMHPEIVKTGPGKCDICGMSLVPAEELGYVAPNAENVGKPLIIPVSAALVTGTRAVVYVEVPDTEQPTFEGREVVLGPRAGDQYIVMAGLEEGERVVLNGNFKIDSALQIMAKPSMMSPEGGAAPPAHDHGAGEMPRNHAEMSQPAMELPPASEELSATIRTIVRDYLQIQTALAGDGRGATKTAAETLERLLTEDEPLEAAANSAPGWNQFRTNALVGAKDIAEATHIEAMRAGFWELTQAIQSIQSAVRTAADETLTVVHCPMAFNSKGASWIQRGEDIQNPYFGAEMLTCGDIVETLTAAPQSHDHDGAQ
jgi:Cu(I)/Ag(I) efflux system membrane fusion protein